MQWYNAGTDERESPPDLFGCIELPLPSACFGEADSVYGPKQRELLLTVVRNDKLQVQP